MNRCFCRSFMTFEGTLSGFHCFITNRGTNDQNKDFKDIMKQRDMNRKALRLKTSGFK